MHLQEATDHDLLRRVHGEYLEMPGLNLTVRQARRLWQLDEETCARLFERLVGAGLLTKTSAGTFIRTTEGAPARQKFARAR